MYNMGSFVKIIFALCLISGFKCCSGYYRTPFTCTGPGRCRDGNGDPFVCVEEFVDCCENPDDTFSLVKSPRGTKCCHGSGDVYKTRTQWCDNGVIKDNNKGVKPCGMNGYYDPKSHICCTSNEGIGQSYLKPMEGQWGCCGSDLINYESQKDCCYGKVFSDLESCCYFQRIIPHNSPSCVQQRKSILEYPCNKNDALCCGGERIEDPGSVFCFREMIRHKSDREHNNVCYFLSSEGLSRETSFNDRVQVCHRQKGPITLKKNQGLCGGLEIINLTYDLCCAGETYRNMSKEWKCCHKATQVYNSKDMSNCPTYPIAPGPIESCGKSTQKRCSAKVLEKRTKQNMRRGSHLYAFTVGRIKETTEYSTLYKVKESTQLSGIRGGKIRSKTAELKVVELPNCGCPESLELGSKYFLSTKAKIKSKKLRLTASKYAILPADSPYLITSIL